MLAFLYLCFATYLGDLLCRRVYKFVSSFQRWATAFLVGLLFSVWLTYLIALLFCRTSKPLLWANIVYFIIAGFTVFWLRRKPRGSAGGLEPTQRVPGSELSDWLTLAVYLAAAAWMMFATFNFSDGQLDVADTVWTDFGPHTSLIQSFTVGNNFPTEYPYFSGEPIRYHFLFYFGAANLEYLGFSLVWSLNGLSILSLVCMLALVMALGQILFNSRSVGRIGSALFFFHGSMAFLPFLRSQHSLAAALHSIVGLREYLPSGYPYRGETWGIWTQSVFVHQRHLASAIGFFLIVLIFLTDRYRAACRSPEAATTGEPDQVEPASPPAPEPLVARRQPFGWICKLIVFDKSFVFTGLILGALPTWNALVFTSAAAVLFVLLLLFPYRRQMIMLAATAGIVGLPQIVWLQSSHGDPHKPSLLHWGYVIEHPTVAKVISYLGFSFGLKWPLILLALVFVTWLHRRLFIAMCSLLLLTFCFQFSVETPANHKFLNIWLIVSNLFAAYALWRLWSMRSMVAKIVGRLASTTFACLIFIAGAIDLFPIHNGRFLSMPFGRDPLQEWLTQQTKPHDVFLSDRFLFHPILLAGRKIFYGCTLFTWSAGYDLASREKVYKQLFESLDPARIFQTLRKNKIDYVAFDNNIRHGDLIKRPNEQIYATFFPRVFTDNENRYAGLTIYKVPDVLAGQDGPVPLDATTMFEGGKGNGKGEFDQPRGLAVDNFGNVLVSDTLNGRIEKFSAAGMFISSIGRPGAGQGEFKEPNGLAVDSLGNVYVADTGNHRVQKLSAGGSFIAEWRGPPPGFYGPRDIAVGADDSIYVLDQGRNRIVKFTANGDVVTQWGSAGSGDGQFSDHTSVAVDPIHDRVYVADPRNQRIQVFDGSGGFLASWPVPEWQNNVWPFQDLVIDTNLGRLYASSVASNAVLMFDLQGRQTGSLKPKSPDTLEGPSSLALYRGKLYVICTFSNRVSEIDVPQRSPAPPLH